jgi:hypothetical protein
MLTTQLTILLTVLSMGAQFAVFFEVDAQEDWG